LERPTGFEPATSSLGSLLSTRHGCHPFLQPRGIPAFWETVWRCMMPISHTVWWPRWWPGSASRRHTAALRWTAVAPGSGNDLAGTDRMARVLGRYQTQLIEPDVTRAEALQLVLGMQDAMFGSPTRPRS